MCPYCLRVCVRGTNLCFWNVCNGCTMCHSRSKWNFKANFPLYFVLAKCYILIETLGARYGDAPFLLQFAVYQPLINGRGIGKIYTRERRNTIWMEWHCIQRGESNLCVVLCYTNVQLQVSKQHIYLDVNNCHVACLIIKNESLILKSPAFLVYWELGGGDIFSLFDCITGHRNLMRQKLIENLF
jgi:hypothetical protein